MTHAQLSNLIKVCTVIPAVVEVSYVYLFWFSLYNIQFLMTHNLF
jgi:hypothetical protein